MSDVVPYDQKTNQHIDNDKNDIFDDEGDDNDVPDDEKTKQHNEIDKNDNFDDEGDDNNVPDDQKTEKHKDCGLETEGNEQESKTNAKKEVRPIGANL